MSICPLLVAVEDAGLTYAEVRRLSWRDLDELIDLFETSCTPEQRRYLETNQL